MQGVLDRLNQFLLRPLDIRSRLLLVGAAVLLAAVYVAPLWNLTMFAPQYPDGLRLDIYSDGLKGGNNNQDIREINVLNHYIGMRDLADADFTEFKWLPFAVGVLLLLYLRASVLGTVGKLVDVLVLNIYFSAFALWSFGYRMYVYGHTLSPTAAVKVAPFMPPLFGYKQLANFHVYSYPQAASYAMAVSSLMLVTAFVVAWRADRRRAREAAR